ncbi:mitochondrial carrier [Martensiomyces pterosporus]|nr:mitochondrial carrier [Martensiomyces pterosporus]
MNELAAVTADSTRQSSTRASESTSDSAASIQNTGCPRGILRPMHSERDHYWPSGGIPPHRERDRRRSAADDSSDIEQSGSIAEDSRGVGDLPAVVATPMVDTGDLRRMQELAHIDDDGARRACQSPAGLGVGVAASVQTPGTATTALSSQPLKNSIAGAGAGCVSSIVTCPLDVVKTRLQYQGVLQEKYIKQGYTPYRGTFNTLGRIFTEEGVRGLYRGLAPMLMGYLPTWGIYFAAYEALKSKLSTALEFPAGHTAVHVGSAMGAGATTSLLTNPIWVLKSRFMTQSAFTEYRYNSMWHAVQMIQAKEGWRGFYKGLGSSLLGVTHVAVQFPLYEELKQWMHVDPAHQLESSRILLASAVSKMVASSVTYPHEVIRTRLQNQSTAPYKYRGILHAVRLIYAEEGLSAFYRGLSTNLIRTVPASMMTLLTYELLIRIL